MQSKWQCVCVFWTLANAHASSTCSHPHPEAAPAASGVLVVPNVYFAFRPVDTSSPAYQTVTGLWCAHGITNVIVYRLAPSLFYTRSMTVHPLALFMSSDPNLCSHPRVRACRTPHWLVSDFRFGLQCVNSWLYAQAMPRRRCLAISCTSHIHVQLQVHACTGAQHASVLRRVWLADKGPNTNNSNCERTAVISSRVLNIVHINLSKLKMRTEWVWGKLVACVAPNYDSAWFAILKNSKQSFLPRSNNNNRCSYTNQG